MARANYKITITDHDYASATYVTWVAANSRNQAIVKAAVLAGGEKTRREWQRTGKEPRPASFLDPEIKIEPADVDEFWDNQEQVVVL